MAKPLHLYALKRLFGFDSFREGQEEAVAAALHGRDVLALMPTGAGKSLCFSLPACIDRGLTIVVSPLLSLIQDQVLHLVKGTDHSCGGIPAAYLSSDQTEADCRAILSDLHRAADTGIAALEMGSDAEPAPFLACKILFVTPERIAGSTGGLRAVLGKLHKARLLSRIVVDECHCVSQWGHDFRPAYRTLGALRTEFPGVPITALTATATPQVVNDIRRSLALGPSTKLVINSFNRPNLRYEVRPKPDDKGAALDGLLKFVLQERRDSDIGIVYCLSRDETEEVAACLKRGGVSADQYHAGMTSLQRQTVQRLWQAGKVRVVVATIAYGMGIDCPRVRFVVHFTVAKSIEGYYQESGRAGRDGRASQCILLYSRKDITRVKRLITLGGKGKRRSPSVLEDEKSKLATIQEYAEAKSGCRRGRLLRYFGQNPDTGACRGTCDLCAPGKRFSAATEKPVPEPAACALGTAPAPLPLQRGKVATAMAAASARGHAPPASYSTAASSFGRRSATLLSTAARVMPTAARTLARPGPTSAVAVDELPRKRGARHFISGGAAMRAVRSRLCDGFTPSPDASYDGIRRRSEAIHDLTVPSPDQPRTARASGAATSPAARADAHREDVFDQEAAWSAASGKAAASRTGRASMPPATVARRAMLAEAARFASAKHASALHSRSGASSGSGRDGLSVRRTMPQAAVRSLVMQPLSGRPVVRRWDSSEDPEAWDPTNDVSGRKVR